MEKINFEDGQLTKKGYVVIDGKEYLINEAQYDGATPLSAYVLNKMQDNIEEGINNIQALPTGGTKGQVLTKQSETNGDANWEDIEANEVFVGNEEEAPSSAKIIVEEDDFVESSTLSKAEVYVGAEEPTAGEKVWFRKGKNKFNTNDKTNGYLNINGSFTSATDWTCSGFIEINSNKYILSANTTARRVIWCEYDGSMNIIGTRHEVAYGNPIAIVSVNTKYIRVCFNDGTATDIQLEQGTTATTYEPYVEDKIYIKNNNGVYEEFTKNDNVISGQVTATTDNVGRILVPIPLGATGANVISVEGNYFTFLRPLQSDKTNSLCYLKDTDNMKAIANTSVTVVWSYIK